MELPGFVAYISSLINVLIDTVVTTVFSMHGFFRLANFGIFIALLVYLYHRYAKDFITSEMKAEEAVLEGLLIEQREAIQAHDAYTQEVARTTQQQAHMQNMIIQWHMAVERERAALALEKSSLLFARKQKAELFADQLRKRVIAQRVVPEAVLAARHQLQEIFVHDQEEGAKAVRRIVSYIASNSHTHK